MADVAGIVREVYFPAPLIYRKGPIAGNRTLRHGVQERDPRLHEDRHSRLKLGLFLGFQTTKGTGGREGLAAQAVVPDRKWQALAARFVAQEMKFHSLWSWGWAEWKTTPGEHDPAKPIAACVYLWTRNSKLCNAPTRRRARLQHLADRGAADPPAGPALPARHGRRALVGDQSDPASDRRHRARVLERVCAGCAAAHGARRVRRHPRGRALDHRFALRRLAWRVPRPRLRRPGRACGRAERDRRRAAARANREPLPVSGPNARQIADYHETYGELQVRLVQAKAQTRGSAAVARATRSTRPRRRS